MKLTKQVFCGNVPIGGGAPVSIQSMTNTDTRDAQKTLEQIRRLADAGCQIIRCAVPDMEAAKAFAAIKARLLLSRDNRGNAVDMAYPLAVCNVAAACLNEAAACGYKQVDADLATSVRL